MNRKETIMKFLGGLLIGGLLLGGGGFALAGSDDATAENQTNSALKINGPKMPGMQKINSEITQSVIESLVSAGTLTQAQADQIQAKEKQLESDRKAQIEKIKAMTQEERKSYCEQNQPPRIDLFTQLVADGTLTQEQVDAIKTATRTKMQEQMQEKLKTALSGLVEKNVISNDQSTAILNQLETFQASRQAQMESVKDMTKEQRQEYMKANKPNKINPLAELVTAGTITQTQADEVLKAIPFSKGNNGMHQGRGNGERGLKGLRQQGVTDNS